MPKFLKLTSLGGVSVYINPHNVIGFVEGDSYGSTIYDGTDSPWGVSETPEEITKLLEALP